MNNDISNTPPLHFALRRRRGLRFCSALAMVAVVAVSGVGLVVGGGVASASSKSATSTKKSLKEFESCMKKHGVKTSFPGAGGPAKGGTPSGTVPSGSAPKGGAKTQKAMKACSKYLPAGSFGGASGTGTTNPTTAFASFRNCMTLHHVTLAKGAYGNTKTSSNVTATTSSTYKTAYSACSTLLPKTAPKSG